MIPILELKKVVNISILMFYFYSNKICKTYVHSEFCIP